MAHPLRAKLRQHILCICGEVHPVKAIPDCGLNGITARDVGLTGCAKGVQFSVFSGIFAGLLIERDCAGCLLLCLQQRICPRLYALSHGIHVSRFHVAEILVNVGQREGGCQQCRRLGCGKGQRLHLHQDVLPHGIFVGVIQHFLRALAQQLMSVPLLFRCHFVIKGIVQCFCIHPKLLPYSIFSYRNFLCAG